MTRGDEYRHIVRKGSRVGGAYFITHAVLHVPGEDHPARFGFVVSRVVGNAVTRNRIRRRLKSLVELRLAAGFRGADVVFRVLPPAAQASFAELQAAMTLSLDNVDRMVARARRAPSGKPSSI